MFFKLIKDAFNTRKDIRDLKERGEELRKETDRLVKQANNDLNDLEFVLPKDSPIVKGLIKQGIIREDEVLTVTTKKDV